MIEILGYLLLAPVGLALYGAGYLFGRHDGYSKARYAITLHFHPRITELERQLREERARRPVPPWVPAPRPALARSRQAPPATAASIAPVFIPRPGTRIPGRNTQANPIPAGEPSTGTMPRAGSITEEFAAITANVNSTAADALREIREGK